MLKSPQRKANATARAVRISGAMRMSVCCRSLAAASRVSPVTQGKNQLSPVPAKIALYAVMGLCPVIATTRPPMRNASTVAAIGTRTPPIREENHSPTASVVDVRGS